MEQLNKLDISLIKSIKDLNTINFSKYLDNSHKDWIRNIKYPVSQDDLNRVCNLSENLESKILLYNSMGELFIKQQIIHN